MRYLIGCMVCVWVLTGFALDASDAVVLDRIRPLGEVQVEGQVTQSAEVQSKPVARTGEAIYNQYCTVCHESGVAGAPKFQNQADWQPRLQKAGGIAGLVSISEKGLNAMPAKGTCSDCTEEELKEAIHYMLPK